MRRRKALLVLLTAYVFFLLTACMSKASNTFQNQNLNNGQNQQQNQAQENDPGQEQAGDQVQAGVQTQAETQEQDPGKLHGTVDYVLQSTGNSISALNTDNTGNFPNDEDTGQHKGSDNEQDIADNKYGISDEQHGGSPAAITPEAPRLVAHAGGDIYGIRMTNSLQALNKSYAEGFRFIEMDISLTSDGIPVLLHDWGNANWFAGIKYSTEQPEYKDFIKRTGILGLEFMDLNKLAQWLAKHDDAYIITDIKENNVEILGYIRENYPEASERIIPQIYYPEEYEPVRNLGYEHIILTLYRIKTIGDEIFEFCSEQPLFGLTIAQSRAEPELLEKYSELGIPIYIHTINDYNEYIKLRDKGAYGVYTDYFEPLHWVE